MVYLILDLDNTVWNKQALDSRTYELVSEAVFGRKISMLKHPVTDEEDHEFPRHSNAQIWRYKLEQIMAAGETLLFHGEPMTSLPSLPILNSLVTALGEYGFRHLSDQERSYEEVQLYLSPEALADIGQHATGIGVATSGSLPLQDGLLQHFGYYAPTREYGIDQALCSFAEDGNSKETLIRSCLDKYFTEFSKYPSQVVYVGDSVNDMSAVQIRRGCKTREGISYKAVGVLTGVDSEQQLTRAGADIVLPSLSDMVRNRKLKSMLQELSRTEIVR